MWPCVNKSHDENCFGNQNVEVPSLYSPQELIRLIRNDLGLFDDEEHEIRNNEDQLNAIVENLEVDESLNNWKKSIPSKTSEMIDVVIRLELLIEDMEEILKEKIVEVRLEELMEERRVNIKDGTLELSENTIEELSDWSEDTSKEDRKVSINNEVFKVDDKISEVKEQVLEETDVPVKNEESEDDEEELLKPMYLFRRLMHLDWNIIVRKCVHI